MIARLNADRLTPHTQMGGANAAEAADKRNTGSGRDIDGLAYAIGHQIAPIEARALARIVDTCDLVLVDGEPAALLVPIDAPFLDALASFGAELDGLEDFELDGCGYQYDADFEHVEDREPGEDEEPTLGWHESDAHRSCGMLTPCRYERRAPRGR